MSNDVRELIDGYFDDTLEPDQQAALGEWIKAEATHARQFAAAVMLHDRLRGELVGWDQPSAGPPLIDETFGDEAIGEVANERRWAGTALVPLYQRMARRAAVALAATCLSLVGVALLWKGFGDNSAQAAVGEVNRLIRANSESANRTYRITVEEVALARRGGRDETPESRRPPKPPLDGAILHVRSGDQFVLIRETVDGQSFVTGCNGKTSWAVRPDGPVRSSADLSRFNRDVPGHEHAMPLVNIRDGLERLREAFELQLLPVEDADDSADEASRLIVAVKKRGVRGPQRVEITYAIRSGFIRQMRFVEMPYGPERLTLRMTLVEERPLGEQFFDHESHHAADRIVEEE